MTTRHCAASLLAATVLFAGAAQACDSSDTCPPGTAPAYPVTAPATTAAAGDAPGTDGPTVPLRVTAERKATQSKKTGVKRTETKTTQAKPTQARTTQSEATEAKDTEAKASHANTAQPRPSQRKTAEANRGNRVKSTEPSPAVTPQPDAADAWAPNVYAMDPARTAAQPQPAPAEPQDQIADPNELIELDRMADAVRVVSADELNEIDLAASSTAAPLSETTGRSAGEEPAVAPTSPAPELRATAPQPMPTSWIAGLVLAFGGVAAAASAFDIRQARAGA
jgi:hypothetical protein